MDPISNLQSLLQNTSSSPDSGCGPCSGTNAYNNQFKDPCNRASNPPRAYPVSTLNLPPAESPVRAAPLNQITNPIFSQFNPDNYNPPPKVFPPNIPWQPGRDVTGTPTSLFMNGGQIVGTDNPNGGPCKQQYHNPLTKIPKRPPVSPTTSSKSNPAQPYGCTRQEGFNWNNSQVIDTINNILQGQGFQIGRPADINPSGPYNNGTNPIMNTQPEQNGSQPILLTNLTRSAVTPGDMGC